VRALGSWLALACLAAGCGKRGDPLPPLRRAPLPVTGLALAQRGDALELRLTAPRAMSDGSRLDVVSLELLVADRDGELATVATRRSLAALPGEAWTETLPLPPPGTRVRVAARARSGRRVSVLSEELGHLVREPPPPPSALEARSAAAGVALRWSPPPRMPEPAAAGAPPPPGPSPPPRLGELTPAGPPPPAAASSTVGFLVYRRAATGRYGAPLNALPQPAASYEDATAEPGERLCYEVRTAAATDPLVESAPAPEACLEVRDVAPPAPPAGLAVIPRDGVPELSWSPGLEADLAAYRVYRAAPGAAPERVAELPSTQTTWRDTQLAFGAPGAYTVTAVDAAGNESAPSAAAELLGAEGR
jgi:hypothetical protein